MPRATKRHTRTRTSDEGATRTAPIDTLLRLQEPLFRAESLVHAIRMIRREDWAGEERAPLHIVASQAQEEIGAATRAQAALEA